MAAPEADSGDLIAAVRAATADAPKRPRRGGFSLSEAGRAELAIAPLLGIYLGYAVMRLPEVFAVFVVPRGPMMMMLVILAAMAFAIPPEAWKVIWRHSLTFRLMAGIVGLVWLTIPIGIWPTGSFDVVTTRYVVAVTVFVACLVFLRDPRALRIAVTIFVLSVTAVSVDVLRTYDPNAIILNDDGEPLDPDVLAARPELRRLASVGIGLDSNDFGAILATAFPLALWLSVGSAIRRVIWTVAAGLMVMAIVPTQSRGSMLGMLSAATVVIGAGARGWRRMLTFLLMGVAGAAFAYMAVKSGASDRFSDFSGDDYNLGNEGRLFFWKQGMVWMIKRPWGYGISNFPTYFGMLNGAERAAHSSWVQYGMELGVAGLVTFCAVCFTLIKGLRNLRLKALAARAWHPMSRDYEAQAGHMLAMLTGVLVTGTFLSNAYYPMMYMAIGMCAATLLGSPFEEHPATPAGKPPAVAGPGGRRRRELPVPPTSR